MDLRGIYVSFDPKIKKKWVVRLPSKKAYDHASNSEVTYPIINFIDPEKNKNLLGEIKDLIIPYIEEKMKNGGFPQSEKLMPCGPPSYDKSPQKKQWDFSKVAKKSVFFRGRG